MSERTTEQWQRTVDAAWRRAERIAEAIRTSTKVGTDGMTPILDMPAPAGMTQAEYDSALTQHQRSRDARNSQSNLLCGGLEVPYLQAPLPSKAADEL